MSPYEDPQTALELESDVIAQEIEHTPAPRRQSRKAVAVQEQRQPVSEGGAVILMIERAAANPDVDMDKMERLLEMQERIMNRNAKAAYDAALAEMQPELPVVAERGAIRGSGNKVQSTYALWEDINEAIKPVLAKHGFAISFRTGREDGQIVVTGVLSHREGHREETTIHLPTDTSGSKNAVQAVGSSTSYGKRYTAQALLNLTSRGEDDDGQAGGRGETITADQVDELQAIMEDVGADKAKFLAFMKVERLADIPAKQFDKAAAALNAKRARA